MHPRYRQTCRICGSTYLVPVIDLGPQFLQGSFVKPGVLVPPKRKLPTQLVICDITRNENGCGLLQLAHTFPPQILYSNYWYRSGTNVTMRGHLARIVQDAMQIVGKSAPTVLDIGCNDGTLLLNYPAGAKLYGVDPSDIATQVDSRISIINTIFPSEQALAVLPKRSFDVVTSIAMFYDIEEPVEFASEVKKLLADDGVWILEMSYLPLMLLQNSFDTICHEHLEYYSLAVLETILSRANLRIFKVAVTDINGGSLRCFVCHGGNSQYATLTDSALINRLRIREFEMELDTTTPYVEFMERIRQLKDKLTDRLAEIKARGERIHVYGASTKGNVLLQWYDIGRATVDCAADRNPEKVGSTTLGTDIPIVSEAESRAAKPDYYLVLPWHFKKEFLQRERDAILAGTKMIFPLPNVEIVSKDNFDQALNVADDSLEQMTKLLFSR